MYTATGLVSVLGLAIGSSLSTSRLAEYDLSCGFLVRSKSHGTWSVFASPGCDLTYVEPDLLRSEARREFEQGKFGGYLALGGGMSTLGGIGLILRASAMSGFAFLFGPGLGFALAGFVLTIVGVYVLVLGLLVAVMAPRRSSGGPTADHHRRATPSHRAAPRADQEHQGQAVVLRW